MLRKDDEPVPGYRLVRFLGRGQFGEVWQANGPGGTRAALKFIDVSGAQGQKELRGVQRVKEIRHPHLMPITALWLLDEDGIPLDDSYFEMVDSGDQRETLSATLTVEAKPPSLLVVAMGYCDKDLSNRLAESNEGLAEGECQGLPVSELLDYMVESAKAIDFLNAPQHDLGDGLVSIQHCDIKPANIMLVGGAVQVCDFGLARMMGDNLKATATGMVGSPAYMAPECIRKRPSSASDQYSLAVTYYELRTGRLPFHDLTYMAVLEAHQAGALEFSGLPEAEQAVLRKATELEPDSRYATCLDMVAALETALADELPDLRSSPTVGKLQGQQSTARSSTTETARAKTTTRDERRQTRRGSRVVTKLGFGLALLILSGIAAVVTVPDIRHAVVGVVETEQDSEGEQAAGETETAVEPIDFTPAFAAAERKLQEGDLAESALLFEKLEQDLLDSQAEDSSSLRKLARLGACRAQSRQPDADWPALLEHIQGLELDDAADGPTRKHAVALELIAETQIGNAPLGRRIRLLVQLEPTGDHLDAWEQRQISQIKTETLAEVAQADVNLDAATWADLKRLGADKVGLLLALARRQHQQADYASSRDTLAEAQPDASPEQLHRLGEILLLNALADDLFDARKAVSRFATVGEDVEDPTDIVRALVERVRRTPDIVDVASEQLDALRLGTGAEFRVQLDRSYAELLKMRIRRRLLEDGVDIADLLDDCEEVRATDQTDPLVNACWVECQVVSATNGLKTENWRPLDTVVRQALRAKEVEAGDIAYFHFVAGLLQHRRSPSRSRDGAEELLKAADPPNQLLQVPRRRRLRAEILIAAAAEIALPTDADLPAEVTADAGTKDAYRYLAAADGLDDMPSDEWQAKYIIAAALVGESQVADKLLQISEQMLGSEDSKAFLESQQLLGQVLLLSAQGYRQRYASQQQPADRDQALRRYASLIDRLHKPRRVDPAFPDVALYTRIVQPAYQLATDSFPELTDVPPELSPSLARIHGAFAKLLERDLAVARLVRGDAALSAKSVGEAFGTAAQLDTRAEYLVGVAWEMLRAPDRIEHLDDLRDLASRIQELNGQLPGGYALQGHALVMEARRQKERSDSRELLRLAIEAFDKAIELSEPGDDDYAINHEGLSAAHLEAAFYTDTREGKTPHLLQAEQAADKALQVATRLRPENAYNCLGNALEDQALYLGDSTKFKPALAAFTNAKDEAASGGRHASKSLSAVGRCRWRWVVYGRPLEGEKDPALLRAEREFDEAIAGWVDMPNKPQAIEHRLAEAQFWRSEVIYSRAMRMPDTAAAQPLLDQADAAREASVQLARTSRSRDWANFQLQWARLAVERAKSPPPPPPSGALSARVAASKKYVFEMLDIAAQRANVVIEEGQREATPLQVAPAAIREALWQLIQADLTRCEFLLLAPGWTSSVASEAEGYIQAAFDTANRIEHKPTLRSAKIAGLTKLGNVRLKSSLNTSLSAQQAVAARDAADKDFREVMQLAGDDIALSAEARFGLAKSLEVKRRRARDNAEKIAIIQESLQILRPILQKHVTLDYFNSIDQYRASLNTLLAQLGA